MADVTVSLWLPVGRANFYSTSANGWLRTDDQRFRSDKLDDPNYVPVLQCSVLRRVLEVAPVSFGYDREGAGTVTDDGGDAGRPVSVTLTLSDVGGHLDQPSRQRANAALAAAGVRSVRLRVDENGNYAFTATVDTVTDAATKALRTHVHEVFGGEFAVNRLKPRPSRGFCEGAASVRRYNGLTDTPHTDGQHDTETILRRDVIDKPKGILTFFQLNTLFEGLANLTLSPPAFFERYREMEDFARRTETAVTIVKSVTDFITLVETTADGSSVDGQVATLRHFLAVTSRETLQKLKWSAESVRRNLLSEMMSVLHRQSRLVQLDLHAMRRERSPELAGEASEAQLRGYVMLIAAKLPLVANVAEMAELAIDQLKTTGAAPAPMEQLQIEFQHWNLLLEGLQGNITSLETAVEQAWMERMLYEQQQTRSEQEAISEIERSRYGQPIGGGGGGRSTWDSWNFVFAALSILLVIATANPGDFQGLFDGGDIPWRAIGEDLLPIVFMILILYVVVPIFRSGLRVRRDRDGSSGTRSYEFAFVLDEATSPERVRAHLLAPRGRQAAADAPPDLPHLAVNRLGGGRIERASADTASIKLHTVVTFKVAKRRYARFEVVHEIRASLVSDDPRYLVHQIRIFGESPRALGHETIGPLIGWVYRNLAKPLSVDETPPEDPMNLLAVFYADGQPAR